MEQDVRTASERGIAPARPFAFTWARPAPGVEYVWRYGHATERIDRPQVVEAYDEDELRTGPVQPVADWAICRPDRLFPSEGPSGLTYLTRFPRNDPPDHLIVPLDDPALFRRFISLPAPGGRDEILKFANAHGMLGIWTYLYLSPIPDEVLSHIPDHDRDAVKAFASGKNDAIDSISPAARAALSGLRISRAETLTEWSVQIMFMRIAVNVWDAISTGNLEEVWKHLEYRPVSGMGREVRGEWVLTYDGVPQTLGWTTSPIATDKEAVEVLRRYLSLAISTRLTGRVHPDLAFKPADGKPVLRLYPDDLLRAMWVQFAESIELGLQFRRCRECDSWFEVGVGKDSRTAKRLFCSDSCKSTNYQKRKGRATELATSGLKPSAIAAQLAEEKLETDVDTVTKWVKAARKKG